MHSYFAIDQLHPLLTPSEYADLLRISIGHAANQRSAGTGPAYIKDGRRVLYPKDGVLAYVRLHMVGTIDQNAEMVGR